ncbi:MAG: amidohydrolase family protein [Verrucomicrobia bacterium]|nr:amidohydrolase family protein [Verrucomicrobiota bacterium]MBV8377536.1 amidohydrolase family protein [Verrucomicrobiota bacterium]
MTAYQCHTLVTMGGPPIENGAFVVEGPRFVKAGRAADVLADRPKEVVDLGEVAVMPGLINAHCHLDYTLMRGAILPAQSFSRWVKRINALKRSLTDRDYLRATQLGFEELQRNGTTTVLNIVSTPQILPLLPLPPIRTWFFLELIDVRPRPWIEEHAFGSWTFFSENGVQLGGLGLSPHAPYTASAKLYQLALECSRSMNLRVTTHVAESREEYAMFANASGELHDFLKQLGRPMGDCGSTSPLRHLIENNLIDSDCIVAHLNELDDRDLEILSRTEWRNLSVVHCPKSHRFLHQNRFPLEGLTERGLNVCLGTDSLASNDSLNLFSEMRMAQKTYQKLTAQDLLEMVTTRPARALKLQHELGKIAAGHLADCIALPYKGAPRDVFEGIVQNRSPIKWMLVNGQKLR